MLLVISVLSTTRLLQVDKTCLAPFVIPMLRCLLVCFRDESWPVCACVVLCQSAPMWSSCCPAHPVSLCAYVSVRVRVCACVCVNVCMWGLGVVDCRSGMQRAWRRHVLWLASQKTPVPYWTSCTACGLTTWLTISTLFEVVCVGLLLLLLLLLVVVAETRCPIPLFVILAPSVSVAPRPRGCSPLF